MVKLISGLLLCAISAGGLAQPSRPGAAWYTAGHVVLGITEPSAGLSGSLQFDRADNGDTRVIKNEQRMGTQVSGSVLAICDNHALLLKDLQSPTGPATLELDGPIHLLQLALRLLDRALPQGPQALTGESVIEVRDDLKPITVTGSNSANEFLAPWQVRGKVARIASDQIRFDLVYSYTATAADGRRLEMSLAGVWHARSRVPAFANDMSLSGWRVYRVDPVGRMVGGAGVLDRKVAPQALSFNTLGELRARIERVWNPNARKQFDCNL